MTIQVSPALNTARLQAVVDFLWTGSSGARVKVYDGARPTFGATPSGILLMTIPLASPIGVIANGLLTVTQTDEAIINYSGLATWARVVNGDDAIAFECDVSENSGSGELKLSQTLLTSGGYARILTGVFG